MGSCPWPSPTPQISPPSRAHISLCCASFCGSVQETSQWRWQGGLKGHAGPSLADDSEHGDKSQQRRTGRVPWGLKGYGTGGWGRDRRESLEVAEGSAHAPHLGPPVQSRTLPSPRGGS